MVIIYMCYYFINSLLSRSFFISSLTHDVLFFSFDINKENKNDE